MWFAHTIHIVTMKLTHINTWIITKKYSQQAARWGIVEWTNRNSSQCSVNKKHRANNRNTTNDILQKLNEKNHIKWMILRMNNIIATLKTQKKNNRILNLWNRSEKREKEIERVRWNERNVYDYDRFGSMFVISSEYEHWATTANIHIEFHQTKYQTKYSQDGTYRVCGNEKTISS